MRLPTRLLAFGATLALLAGCGGVSSDAAATVDGEEISRDLLTSVVTSSRDQVLEGAEQSAGEAGQGELSDEQRDEVLAAHQRGVLTLLIQDRIITSMVDEAGVSEDDVDAATIREDILEQVGGEEQLEELLQQDGLSLELFDEVLLPQQARVVALREELAGGEDLETRTIRHILVETEEEADEVVADLDAGGDFAEIAEERSTDTGSAQNGGELPAAPRGSYVPGFEEAAWESEVGELVGPVESQFGFHVLEVLSEDVTPASELDDAQVDQLVNEQINSLLEEAYADAEVEVDEAFGVWDDASRSVVAGENVGEPSEAPADDLDLGEPETGDTTGTEDTDTEDTGTEDADTEEP